MERDPEAGGTLAFGDVFAFDIATDTCYRLPDMHDRHRRGALYLWMGDGMLIWSSGRSEESPPGRDGITFQPMADDAN